MNISLRNLTPVIWRLTLIMLLAGCTLPDSDPANTPVATNTPFRQAIATSLPVTSTIPPHLTPSPTKSLEANETADKVLQSSTPIPTLAKPTFTPAISPNSTPSLLNGPLIAFDAENSETGQGVILVFDTSTGSSREYTPEQVGGAIVGFDWSHTGCELFVAIQSSGTVQYVTIDLAGNKSKPDSQPIPFTTDEGFRYAWTISSTQEWIAFLLGFGEDEEGFDFGFKDTWVIKNAQGVSTPIAMTHNSWTLEPVWSPSGDRLAFTNHDSAGIPQLYHSASDGSDLVQVTHFSEPIDHIQGIRWSPDGQWLSFSTFNNGGWPLPPGQSALWSITRDGQNLHQAELGDFVIRRSPWWADDSASYSAYVELWSEEASKGLLSSKIVWVNPQDGTIMHEFIPDEIKFEQIFPVGGNEIIGFLGTNYTQYDKATGSVLNIGEPSLVPVFPRGVNPLYGPYDFQGEAYCRQ